MMIILIKLSLKNKWNYIIIVLINNKMLQQKNLLLQMVNVFHMMIIIRTKIIILNKHLFLNNNLKFIIKDKKIIQYQLNLKRILINQSKKKK